MSQDEKKQIRSQYAGKEIFEITPVILGGDPVDPANKVVLSREDHIQAVNYWNGVIQEMKETGTPGQNE